LLLEESRSLLSGDAFVEFPDLFGPGLAVLDVLDSRTIEDHRAKETNHHLTDFRSFLKQLSEDTTIQVIPVEGATQM